MADYRDPSPDAGHEAIRKPLAEAIDRLDAQVDQINDAYLLLLSTTDFAASTLRTVLAGQAAIVDLSKRVAAIEARLQSATPDSDATPDTDAPPEDLT